MAKRRILSLICFILILSMLAACAKSNKTNEKNNVIETTKETKDFIAESETELPAKPEKETTTEFMTETSTERVTEPPTETPTEVATEPVTEPETEPSTELETQVATQPATQPTTQPKPKPTTPIETETEYIYIPPYEPDYGNEIYTETPIEPETEAIPEIYTVKVNVYKEVNGVKSYVKTITVSGEKKTLYEIPLTLPEDTRCKIAVADPDLTGVVFWEKGPYQIAYINNDFFSGYLEDGVLKSEIRKNAEYDITYYYRDFKVNVVLFDEDYQYRIVDTYTISGGLGDVFTLDLAYSDEPIYELYSIAGFSDIEEEGVFVITNNGVPGHYEINSTYFKMSIVEMEIQYFGYTYSKPVYDSVIKPGMSEYDKAKAIHDWIVTNCYYDFNGEYGYESYSQYGIFKNKYGVCDGYTYGFKRLAEMAGLECERYVCYNHSWNRVKIDGEWYNVDCTYSDIDGTFFLKSDEYFVKKGYQWGFEADGVCNSTKYD